MTTVPPGLGGWWHDYVCPTHGTELVGVEGSGHRCSRGCTVTGPRVDGARSVLDHQACAREIRLLARRAASTGSGTDRDRALSLLSDYADVYAGAVGPGWSEAAEPWMLRGRLFSQALTEAQWAVQIADAVILCGRDAAGPGVVTMLEDLLATFEQAYAILVDERQDERNNYTAWLGAAGALVAQALEAPATVTGLWRERVLQHVGLAVRDDGWEWEASVYYHLFVLRAYLLALRGAVPTDLPPATTARLAAMVRVLAEVAAPDGRLPALHDGPYERVPAHREVLEVAELARGLVSPTGLDTVERFARERLGDADDGLEPLLSGWFVGAPVQVPAPSRASVLFPDVGYAVLRDDDDTFQAILDAGPHGGSHGHLDKLAVYLYGAAPWQPGPGVPPYASPLRRGYYARTVAHPTVRVDGQDQDEATGKIAGWDPDAGTLTATAEPVAGVRVRRSLRLSAGCLVDVVTVECGSPREVSLALRPAVGLEVLTTADGAETTWRAADGTVLRGFHAASVPASLVAAPGRGPSDDPARPLTVADWTATGDRVVLASLYHQGPRPPSPVTIAFAPDGGAIFHLTTPDGDSTIEVSP
ncbi:heparinase II/III family protein [Isoptericola halotolerans]|uniref:heparinase II/III domain-containing protein n=1 Tax=Isoptericola halotolerans TaxID=300560 RepID=UPI00388DD474